MVWCQRVLFLTMDAIDLEESRLWWCGLRFTGRWLREVRRHRRDLRCDDQSQALKEIGAATTRV